MREILFRGKQVGYGEWTEGYVFPQVIDGGYAPLCITTEPICANDYSEILGDWAIVDSSTIGQYTGLTDKNGKKIFEGDILAAPDYPNLKYKVSFANANFCVKCPAQSYLFYLGSRCFDMFGNPEYEIVGNIHDNPELLEVTK